jgi:hypothetical protein
MVLKSLSNILKYFIFENLLKFKVFWPAMCLFNAQCSDICIPQSTPQSIDYKEVSREFKEYTHFWAENSLLWIVMNQILYDELECIWIIYVMLFTLMQKRYTSLPHKCPNTFLYLIFVLWLCKLSKPVNTHNHIQ